MKQLHTLQLQILKRLLFATHLRYSDLKPEPEIENNQLDFHLDQLIRSGYVIKVDSGYSLTPSGKEYANRMDTDKAIIQKQAKLSVFVCARRAVLNSKEYLIYTRLKQPFYGCQGFLSGKINYGETVLESAERELGEETGLSGKPQIVSIKHYRVYDRASSELLEDKFMFFCCVEEPSGELRPHDEGKYEWVPRNELFTYVTNHFVSMDEFRNNVAEVEEFNGVPPFEEIDQYDDRF